MAKFHKVVKAFQATNKETGQPVEDQYGNSRWMFQVENQGPDGWMSVNKKAGTELEVGSYVYGIIDTWPEGKAKFVRQQPPEGEFPPESSATPRAAKSSAPVTAGGSSVDSKLDYIISLLENRSNFQQDGQGAGKGGDVIPEDIDEGGPSLEDLDY